MLPVEILPVQETIILRARGSELLILPHHVKKLKGFAKPGDFSQYFRGEALVNRPARKLFEAWLRKDQTLWPRLYHTVHKEIEFAPDSESAEGHESSASAPAVAVPPQNTVDAAPVAPTNADHPVEAKPERKKTAKAKPSDTPTENTAPKKSVKKAATPSTDEEPKKKEKAPAKKAAPKEKSTTTKKETTTTKPKAKAAAADKPKSKKG